MSKRVAENENKFTSAAAATAAVAAVAVAGSSKASISTASNDDSIENDDDESIAKGEGVKKTTGRPNKRTRSDERNKVRI